MLETLKNLARKYKKTFTMAGVFVVWLCSVYAVRGLGVLATSASGDWSDLATILFGSASIALTIFSILIALSAVIGWKAFQELMATEVSSVAEKKVNEKVDSFRQKFEETNEKMKKLELEMKGRALVTQGYILGQVSIPKGRLFPVDEKEKGRLAEAVGLSRQAYDMLQGISEPAEYMALNNLVVFSCALGLEEGGAIVEQARKLLLMAVKKGNVDLQLTGCRAILQYKPNPSEVERARRTLRDLLASPTTTQGQRAEADLCLMEFSEDFD